MKTKPERIAALVASEHSPVRTKAALEAMTEPELAGLEAHVEKKVAAARTATQTKQTRVSALIASPHNVIKTEAALNALSDEELTTLEATVKTATEAATRAAAAPAAPAASAPTEEEWMRTAPASVRSLVESARKLEETRKTGLVTQLKAAQKVYGETELNAMSIEQLEKVATLANVEHIDFGGLGFPRSATSDQQDVYRNPPDGYRAALDAKKPKKDEATH